MGFNVRKYNQNATEYERMWGTRFIRQILSPREEYCNLSMGALAIPRIAGRNDEEASERRRRRAMLEIKVIEPSYPKSTGTRGNVGGKAEAKVRGMMRI